MLLRTDVTVKSFTERDLSCSHGGICVGKSQSSRAAKPLCLCLSLSMITFSLSTSAEINLRLQSLIVSHCFLPPPFFFLFDD